MSLRTLLLLTILGLGYLATSAAVKTPFVMAVADTFTISGRGVVVSGSVERGTLKVKDVVELVGVLPTKQATVSGLQAQGRAVEQASAGQEVSIILSGVSSDEVRRGQVVAEPGSLKAFRKAKASVALLSPEQGERKSPIGNGYRLLCRFRGVDFSASFQLPGGQDSLSPGQSDVRLSLQLEEPVALEKGQRFEIKEAGKTIGQGEILSTDEEG